MAVERILLGLVVTVVLVVAAFLAIGDMNRSDLSETRRLQNELESLGQINRGLEEENRRLERNIRALKTNPAVMEQAAREDFGYIRDGELVLVFPK